MTDLLKLSPAQLKIILLMENGWKLHYLHFGLKPGPYMTKGKEIPQSRDINKATFFALHRRGVLKRKGRIKLREKTAPSSVWVLAKGYSK